MMIISINPVQVVITHVRNAVSNQLPVQHAILLAPIESHLVAPVHVH